MSFCRSFHATLEMCYSKNVTCAKQIIHETIEKKGSNEKVVLPPHGGYFACYIPSACCQEHQSQCSPYDLFTFDLQHWNGYSQRVNETHNTFNVEGCSTLVHQSFPTYSLTILLILILITTVSQQYGYEKKSFFTVDGGDRSQIHTDFRGDKF